MTPLHAALLPEDPVPSVVRDLLRLNSAPLSIPTSDDDGDLPIHLACRRADMPLEILVDLVEFYPEGKSCCLKMENKRGDLPIHLACATPGTTLDKIAFLMDVCPESSQVANGQGMYPLQIACNHALSMDVIKLLLSCPRSPDQNECEDLLFWAAEHQVQTVLYLLDMFPEQAISTSKGRFRTCLLPLHLVLVSQFCQNGKAQIVKKFVELHPEIIYFRHDDNICLIPLRYAIPSTPRIWELLKGEYASPLLFAMHHCPRPELILYMAEHEDAPSASLCETDGNGRTPLHLACHVDTKFHNSRCRWRAIKCLSNRNAEGCLATDKDGNLPIHVACNTLSLDESFFLLDEMSVLVTKQEVWSVANHNGELPLHTLLRTGW